MPSAPPSPQPSAARWRSAGGKAGPGRKGRAPGRQSLLASRCSLLASRCSVLGSRCSVLSWAAAGRGRAGRRAGRAEGRAGGTLPWGGSLPSGRCSALAAALLRPLLSCPERGLKRRSPSISACVGAAETSVLKDSW